jgi:hypothetical protein
MKMKWRGNWFGDFNSYQHETSSYEQRSYYHNDQILSDSCIAKRSIWDINILYDSNEEYEYNVYVSASLVSKYPKFFHNINMVEIQVPIYNIVMSYLKEIY